MNINWNGMEKKVIRCNNKKRVAAAATAATTTDRLPAQCWIEEKKTASQNLNGICSMHNSFGCV